MSLGFGYGSGSESVFVIGFAIGTGFGTGLGFEQTDEKGANRWAESQEWRTKDFGNELDRWVCSGFAGLGFPRRLIALKGHAHLRGYPV